MSAANDRIARALASLRSTNPEDRCSGAKQLGNCNDLEENALSALVAALEDDGTYDEVWTDWDGTPTGGTTHSVADAAAQALAQQGKRGIVALMNEAARTPTIAPWLGIVLARSTANTIVSLGVEDCNRALSVLTLQSANPTVVLGGPDNSSNARAMVLWALREIELDGTARLFERLNHPRSDVVLEAVRALAAVPDKAHAAEMLAKGLLGDGLKFDYLSQSAACEALLQLGPVLSPERVQGLIERVQRREFVTLWTALLPAIIKHTNEAQVLLPFLTELLRDKAPPGPLNPALQVQVRDTIAASLRALGGVTDLAFREELFERFHTSDENEQRRAMHALGGETIVAQRVMKQLKRDLSSAVLAERRHASQRLLLLGTAAKCAMPEALALLQRKESPFSGDRYWEFSNTTKWISVLEEKGTEAVPCLLSLLERPKEQRFWVLHALRVLGRHDQRVLPALEAFATTLKAPDGDLQTILRYLRS